jgi:hypothetical protein
LPFITSDNPALNILLDIKDFCFPISGKKAIIMRKKDVPDNSFSQCDKNAEGVEINLSLVTAGIYNLFTLCSADRFLFGQELVIHRVALLYKFLGKSGNRYVK